MEDQLATYVKRLRAALRPLSPEEQEQVLAELESHIAEGMEDERLGGDLEERKAALMREMGNPDELGYELQHVNGRRRWLDFLLAAVPALILLRLLEPLVASIVDPTALPLFSTIALGLLPLCLLMLAIARRRRADGLLIFWLWVGLDIVLTAWQWTGFGAPHLPYALFWGALALGGFAWLLHVLWRVRRVPLLLWWGLLPLLLQLLQLPPLAKATAILKSTLVGNPAPGGPLNAAYRWQGAILLEFGLALTALALFFIARGRWQRWAGLALFFLAPSLANTAFWGSGAAGIPLIAALPLTIIAVLAGILLEQRRKGKMSLSA